MDETVRLHDTLTDEKIELVPLAPDGIVRMYVCGITPYSESHVGHALKSIVFDVLRRYLEWRGFALKHVENFTDIDDKLIDRSQRLGVPMSELAEQNIQAYLANLQVMNILPAHEYPRVTERVPHIISLVEGLIANGHAYASGGDVYYRVRSFGGERYGALSKRDIDELRSGSRVDLSELKDDPLDFALWKGAKPGEPSWDSPWGPGRPGWHIECSAMALTSLGEEIDIHGGGADLIFPHHTNEIAQSEGFTGKPFARIWVHCALLQLGAEKMSKSLGNLVTIGEALERSGPDALRMFVLTSHYRSPSTYSDEAMEAAAAGARRLREAAFVDPREGAHRDGEADSASAARDRFIAAMDDDLNTPQALAVLFELARDVNRARDGRKPFGANQAALRELCRVLGLTLEAPKSKAQEAAPFVDLLVSLRTELRAAKQWALADRVRDGLAELGVEVKDSPQGTTWEAR
jgi:cysteinyl-tRNA synthetase